MSANTEQPMTENQKLREALQAISYIDDTTNHSVDASAALDRIGQIARQALALPTAATEQSGKRCQSCGYLTTEREHLGCLRKAVQDLDAATGGPCATDASASVYGLTAAPVGEREAFEREMSKPPFEFCMDRWPDGTVQEGAESPYAWMSDDFEYVDAVNEEQAHKLARMPSFAAQHTLDGEAEA